MIIPEVEAGTLEILIVTEEAGKELLLQLYVDSLVRVRDKISRVIRDDDSGSEGGDVLGCPVEEADVVEIFRVHVAEHEVGTHVEVGSQTPQEFEFDLLFQSFLFGFAVFMSAGVITDAPEFAGEGEEVHVGVEPETVTREDAIVPDSQQVETRGGDVPVDGDVGGGYGFVVPVDTVQPGCHESEPQFGVARKMRSPDNREVDSLFGFLFVGVREITVEPMEESGLHGCGVNGDRVLPVGGKRQDA